jgi:hypothetical protein
MYDTTRGILENFLSMVQKYGFVPNGGRVYYVQRSQPPLLIPMVDSYVTQTGNTTFLKNNINLLEAEFQFWMTNRTVTVNINGMEYKLARYYAATQGPRPESYRYILSPCWIVLTVEEHLIKCALTTLRGTLMCYECISTASPISQYHNVGNAAITKLHAWRPRKDFAPLPCCSESPVQHC